MDRLTDGVKKLLLAGVGAVATTADKGQEVFDSLVEKGELTVEQGKALNKELKHKAKARAEEDKETVRNQTGDDSNFLKNFNAIVAGLTAEQLEELKKKVDAAEANVKEKAKANDNEGEVDPEAEEADGNEGDTEE